MTLPSPSPSHIATDLAELAAHGALSVAGYLRAAARTAPPYDTKRDLHDPVTAHDRAVETALHNFFGAAIPGSRVLGEEMGEQTLPSGVDLGREEPLGVGARYLGSRVRWIIDPIDGTANFASGSTYFGTSIGVELDGRIVAGAISIPYTEELFVADLHDAWHIDRHGQRSPLRSSGPTVESQAVLLSYYPGLGYLRHQPDMAMRHQQLLMGSYMAVRRPGAGALDLAMVAAGWAGAMLGTSFGPWDVAAGIHLVKIAGGHILNLPMRSALPDGLRPAVLATVGSLDASAAQSVLREVDEASRR